jgi:N-methylhydantoinase B/oxoprolinase/acetone carboxylase alpha subunit
MRVHIDVGGMFTDLVAIDADRIEIVKVPSTPASPAEGLFGGERGRDRPSAGRTRRDLRSEIEGYVRSPQGDIIALALGDGSGYGPAADRAQRQIDDDAGNGPISDGVAKAWTLAS